MLNFLISLFTSATIAVSGVSLTAIINPPAEIEIPKVPLYSQFYDISDFYWQKLGCGIASLAMIIEYYKPEIVSVDGLLNEGIATGAFIEGAGWSHWGLVRLAQKYGFTGAPYSFPNLSGEEAFEELKNALEKGPVIASVHYTLKPTNPIPHLIVVNGVKNDIIYYNDPAEELAGKKISVSDFIKAWKKRFIVIRPELLKKSH